MDESYLPWWLILLIGMWAVALTVWQHPTVHREVRWWAGFLTLVYLGLFFVALGTIPNASVEPTAETAPYDLSKFGFWFCVAIGLSAGTWFVGRIHELSRQLSYALISLANAGIAFLVHAPEVGLGLLIVAGLAVRNGYQRWQRNRRPSSSRPWLTDLIRLESGAVSHDQSGVAWLVGGLGAVFACLLLGTIAYSMRYEATRPASSTRLPALPSRAQLEEQKILSNRPADLVDVVSGSRADVVVLFSVILFLCLAVSSAGHRQHNADASDASMERLT